MEKKEKVSNDNEFKTVSRKRKLNQAMDTSENLAESRPHFPAYKGHNDSVGKKTKSIRKIFIPSNRYTPLKENWMKLYTPICEHLKLQVRFNLKTRNVELQTCVETTDISALQKAADFVRAFVLGFSVEDALAVVRLDELFLESFQVTDVKRLKGDHLSRAIGRVAGTGGSTKFIIENATRTRIVLANTHVHILGSYQNIRVARTAICNLILGSPPGKVYGNMKAAANKLSQQF